nr:MAG: capsid protein [Cressdnaviricota sp.]
MARKKSFKKTKKSFKKKRTVKKRSFKKRSFKKSKMPLKSGTGAHTVETVDFGPITLNSGDPYEMAFQISQFVRATAIQAEFRFYRATKVEWVMEPAYDQYPANVVLAVTGAVSSDSIPYVYIKMDRTGSAPFQTAVDFKDSGLLPRKWDRKITTAYRPNWLGQWQGLAGSQRVAVSGDPAAPGLSTNPEGFGPTAYQVNNAAEKPKWGYLPTVQKYQNPDSGAVTETFDNTIHWGHQVYLYQQNLVTGSNPRVYGNLLCRVHWEFKDPYVDQALALGGPGVAAKQLITKPQVK